MNPDAARRPNAPHTNPAINAAIDAAKSCPVSTIEASTEEGATKVTIGEKLDDARPFIIEVSSNQHCGPSDRARTSPE